MVYWSFWNTYLQNNLGKTRVHIVRKEQNIVCSLTQLKTFDFRAGLVFSNWLLMYLSDEEVRTLLTKILRWLDEDGFLFFRESCFNQSGRLVQDFVKDSGSSYQGCQK